MQDLNNPDFVEALQKLFVTRQEIRAIVEHQQKLFATLKQLDANHHTVHDHVRVLTESHNRVQGFTTSLVKGREEVVQALQNLDDSHRETKQEIQKAMDALEHIQGEIGKVNQLETRLAQIERTLNLSPNNKEVGND